MPFTFSGDQFHQLDGCYSIWCGGVNDTIFSNDRMVHRAIQLQREALLGVCAVYVYHDLPRPPHDNN